MLEHRCSTCNALIRWAVTERGKPMPLDDNAEDAGNIWIEIPADPREAPIAHVVTKNKPAPDGHALWTSHFATCPDAKDHRREKPKAK